MHSPPSPDAELAAENRRLRERVAVLEAAATEYATRVDRATSAEGLALAQLDAILDAAPAGIGLLDSELRFVRVNANLAALHGCVPAECLGHSLGGLLPDLAAQVEPTLRQVLATGVAVHDLELSISRDSTPELLYDWLLSCAPVRGSDDTPGGVAVTLVDVTQARQTQAALRASAQAAAEHAARLESLLAHAPVGITMIDTAFRYQHINPHFAHGVGLTSEDYLGRSIREVIPALAPLIEARYTHVFATGAPLLNQETVSATLAEPEVLHTWQSSYFPVRDAAGTLIGAGAVIIDITARCQIERDLRASEARYRTLFETIAQGVIVYDSTGRAMMANPAAEQILRLSRQEILDQSMLDPRWSIVGEDGRPISPEAHPLLLALQTGQEARDVVLGLSTPTHTATQWIRLQVIPQIQPGEAMEAQIYAILEDITEWHQTQRTLEYERQQLAAILNTMHEGVIAARPDGTIVLINPAALQLRDLDAAHPPTTMDDLLKTPHRLFDKRGQALTLEDLPLSRVLRGESFSGLELCQRSTRGGRERWNLVSGTPVYDDHGALILGVITFQDISRRKTDEAALQAAYAQVTASAQVAMEQAARLESLLSYAPIGIALMDPELRYQHINVHLAAINGLTEEEHLGRTIREVVPRVAAELEAIFGQVLTSGMPLCDIEITAIPATDPGVLHTWACSYFPVRGADGGLLGAGVIVNDITARRQAEQALQVSQQNLSTLIENIDGTIWSVDAQYRLLVCNSRFQHLISAAIGRDLVAGECLLNLPLPQPLLGEWRAWCDRALAGERFSVEIPTRFTPELRTVECRLSPIQTTEGTIAGVTVFGRDITERLQAELDLRESERKLSILFTLLPVGISILDAERTLVYANPALEQILHLDRANLFRGDYQERQYLRPDGTLLPDEEFASARAFSEHWPVNNIETGIVTEVGEVIWTSVSAVPVDFPDWRVIVVTTDITARKQAEEARQAFARRLVVAQEVERTNLARELHDEVGQMLTGLNIVLESAQQRGADEPQLLAEAQASVNELTALVRQLSLTLRPAMLDDLGLLPTLHWHLDRYTAQTGIQVQFQHAGLERAFDAPLAITAYRLVQEALSNVARHAGVTSAQLTVWADATWLTVQVEDAGCGFDVAAALAAHTSRGLAGMRERVMLLAGEFDLDSAPGAGTRLYAALPLAVSTHLPGGG